MLVAFFKTLRLLCSVNFFKYVLLSILLTGMAYSVFGYSMYKLIDYGVTHINAPSWKVTFGIISGAGGVAIGWFLLPIIVPMVAALFQDSLAKKIEHKYPQLKKQPIYLATDLKRSVNFLLLSVVCNLACLPVYFMPVLNVAVYYIVNAYLIGTCFFIEIGLRYYNLQQVTALYKKYHISIFLLGLMMVLITNIPIVNFMAPLIAIALMVYFILELKPST
jgi:CysZ protein